MSRYSTSEMTKCLECPKSFKNKSSLYSHIKNTHGVQNYACDVCEFKTVTSIRLLYHSRTHETNRERKYICKICKKGFCTLQGLKSHLKIHEVDKKQVGCYFCRNVYKGSGSLYIHLKYHTKERVVGVPSKQCRQCTMVFLTFNELHNHVRRQHGVARPHKCDLCGFKMQTNRDLKRHLAITHSTLRPFSCSLCPAEFKESGKLIRHVQDVHFGVKEYNCDKCPKMFTTLPGLRTHVQSVHFLIKPFLCPICGKRYGSKRSFKCHLRDKHEPKGYTCYFCCRAFAKYDNYQAHVYSHTLERHLKCRLVVEGKPCGFTTCRTQQFNIHTRVVHEGYRIPCSLCSYKATSKQTLFGHITRIHTCERPLKCVECGRQFCDRSTFKKHKCRGIEG